MIPKPTPPTGICRRYDAEGRRCENTTCRADGWCGKCGGFTTPESAGDLRYQRGLPTYFAKAPFGQVWKPTAPPIDSDEAYDGVSIKRTALQRYAEQHSVSLADAEAQIRSLLEDLLLSGQIDRSADSGTYRLMFRTEGYLLLLDAEAGTVVNYGTTHVERTWAQVKSGVASRGELKGPKTKKRKKWLQDLLDSLDNHDGQGIRITFTALDRYAGKLTRENGAECLREMSAKLRALRPLLGADSDHLVDGDGGRWEFEHEKEGEGLVLTSYVRPENTKKQP
ncbi:hypothetical protein ACFYXM_11260 [Streptomyces sp. NPDC002476]|uniref:hypothetical protein n=1 Tax=Streptomyces sp. NPDC002476 TaxID=3364648 RepID=UPI0036B5B14C